MLFCIRTSFKPSILYFGILGIDCKVLHYVLKCVLREIRAVVLSEDKAQDKGKRIIVVNCYFYFCCQLIIQYVSQ